MDKKTLREQMKSRRARLTAEEVCEKSRAIASKILALPQISASSSILLYLSINKEVAIETLAGNLLDLKKNIYLPFYDANSQKYAITKFLPQAKLAEGPYGIKQPQKTLVTDPNSLDCAIIPGLAFDHEGFRLGYGKGVYDLMLYEVELTKIGICYDFQLLETVPRHKHDLKMDLVVTEEKVLEMN